MEPSSTEALLAKTIGASLPPLCAPGGPSPEGHLLQMLMDSIPNVIYFKDAQSRFICINRAHASLFGLKDPSEAIGKTDADFFTAAHANQARADEEQVLRNGQPLVGFEEKETWPERKYHLGLND